MRDLRLVFEALAGEGLHKILVEGGGEVHVSVLQEAGLADEACVFVAPRIVGGRGAKTPVEGEGFGVPVERSGDGVVIRGKFKP